MPPEVRLLKAYGAEVVITPTNVAPDSPESYNGVADRLAREIPGAWRPNQFTNLSNPEVHYRATGHEIWEQTEGKITAFVAGVGTGGTISGVARYLKEQNPEVRIVGAPLSRAAAVERVRRVAEAARGIPLSGYSLSDLEQLAVSEAVTLRALLEELRAAGLELVADAPVDRLRDARRSIEEVNIAGLVLARLTVGRRHSGM